MTTIDLADPVRARAARPWRHLPAYPAPGARRAHLALVVAITVALYYAQYVGGGVATLMLPDLRMPFIYFVAILSIGNLIGAFASLLAGLADRFGRCNLVVAGLFLVAALTLVGFPLTRDRFAFGVESAAVSFVEGIVLVATPALIRDFSPQVGRATAMGFWTIGPVLGSLMVSAVATLTLPRFVAWQSQYVICGAVCLATAVAAAALLRELSPALRDQIMVSERDRELNALRAETVGKAAVGKAAVGKATPGNPPPGPAEVRPAPGTIRGAFASLAHLDVIASALGVSVLLLFYYTAVAFGTIYLVTVLHFTVAAANAVGNWAWGANAVALIVAGVLSDRLRVRKPFMLGGAVAALAMTVGYLLAPAQGAGWWTIVALSCGQSIAVAFAYATWMASFTETVEARNPAATATGLAIWGWLLRLVVTASFVAVPFVIDSVTPLVGAGHVLAEYARAQAAHAQPSPELLAELAAIKSAAGRTAAQWRTWYWICAAGIAAFIGTVFLMRGHWSPARARADEAAHDARTAGELRRMREAEAG